MSAIVFGIVGHDVGRAAATGVHTCEDVDAAVGRPLGVGHLEREAAQLLLRRVVEDHSGPHLMRRFVQDDHSFLPWARVKSASHHNRKSKRLRVRTRREALILRKKLVGRL